MGPRGRAWTAVSATRGALGTTAAGSRRPDRPQDAYGHLMGTDADRAALERVNRALGDRTGTAEGDASLTGKSGEATNGL